jgi:hypothetical protein
MEKIKMITRCAPGVLEVEMGLPVEQPQTEAERAKLRKSKGPRAFDSRLTRLDEATVANLNDSTRAKLDSANEAIQKRKLEEAHAKHSELFKGLAGTAGGKR